MITVPPRRFEDVKVGDSLPPLEFTASLTALVMYAGATWDFHRYHYDPAFVADAGLPAPFMDGQMLGALFARMLMNWGGRDAFVRRLSYRQRTPVYQGESFVLNGSVTGTSTDGNRRLAHIGLNAVKADGSIISRDATALVELGSGPA